MTPGRQKKHNPGLPQRMRQKGNAYYYVKNQKWTKIGDSYAEAIARWQELEGVRLEGSTVGHAIDRYILEILPEKAQATQREYKRYATRLREVFGDTPLEYIEQTHIAQYLDRRSSKYEANREVAMLSSVYNGALRWGWCKRNPCLGVRRNPEKRRERHLTDAEIARVRAAAGPQVQCIMDLVLLTALRKADVLKIKLSDWTAEGLRVEVQKTGRVLIFERTPGLREVWKRCRKLRRRVTSLSLFCNRNGQQYTTSGFDSIWQRTLKRAGVQDFRFHDLRARALTDAQKEFGLEYAQLLAAHVNITTTERYVRDRRSKVVRPLK